MVFRKRLGALLVLASSCGGEQAPSVSEQAPPPGSVAAENPQEAARRKSSVRHFLRWYQSHQAELDRLLSATVSKQGRGDTAHYQVNYARAQQYLNYLTNAGWFTPQFVREQAQQFRRRDVDFRRTRQAYGPPVGFGFGWVLYTPQPEKVVAAALATGRITATETGAGQWQARVQLPDNGRLVLDLVAAADSARIETIYPDGIEQLAGQ